MIKMPTIIRLFTSLPYKRYSIFWIFLTTFIINLFSLVIPVYFMHIFDKIIPNKSEYTLIIITVGALIVIILEAIFEVGRGVIASWYSIKFSYKTSSRLIRNLFAMTNKEYFKNSVSDYSEGFKSVEKLKKVYQGQLFQSIIDIPFIFMYLYGIYYISGNLVLFHIGVLAIYFLYNIFYYLFSAKFSRDVIELDRERTDLLSSILKKIHPLKAQGLEEMLLRKLEETQKNYTTAYMKMKNYFNIPSSIGAFFSQVMIYGTIVIGGIYAIRGDLSFGVISAATMLSRRTVGPLLSISKLSSLLSQSKQDYKRLDKFNINYSDSTEDFITPEHLEGDLDIRGLWINKNDTDIGNLRNINLRVREGLITGIHCYDTSAASILIDAIMGIEKPDKGTVLFDSIILNKLSGSYKLSELSIIPRNPELFLGTIIDNITLFKTELISQAFDTGAFLGLDEIVSKLPKGYYTEITPFSDKTLPISMIKRISLARSLVNRPRVIISNQADSGMNLETKELFIEILNRLKLNTAILIISDNSDFLNFADVKFILNKSELTPLRDNK